MKILRARHGRKQSASKSNRQAHEKRAPAERPFSISWRQLSAED